MCAQARLPIGLVRDLALALRAWKASLKLRAVDDLNAIA
jgi:hypothetical protein